MLYNILYVGIGGLAGSILRYLIAHLITQNSQSQFPWATTLVNIIGSIVIGVLFAYFERNLNISNEVKLLLTTGFCGGFTTFSTFSIEFIQILNNGSYFTASVYLFLNVFVSIFLCLLSYKLIR